MAELGGVEHAAMETLEAPETASDGTDSVARTDFATLARYGWAALALVLVWVVLRPSEPRWELEYFDNRGLTGPARLATLSRVDFASEAKLPAGLVDVPSFSMRLKSCFVVQTPGRFQFRVTADNGARISLNGVVVTDAWNQSGRRVVGDGFRLERGKHPLTIEYYNSGGTANLSVEVIESGVHDFRDLDGMLERVAEDGSCGST